MTFNEFGVGCRFDHNGLLDEPVEQFAAATGRAAIEPEGVLVQVVVELLPGYPSLVDAQKPTLEERGNAMEARKRVRSDLSFMNIAVRLEHTDISGKPIGDDDRAGGHRLLHELDQSVPGSQGYLLEADPPCAELAPLDGDEYDRLVSDDPASGGPLPTTPNHGFVHFDFPGQGLAIGTDHGATQLVQARPSRAITSDPQGPLHSQRTDTGLLIGEPPNRSKPKAQGQVAVLKDRPGGRRGHGAAILALPELSLQLPTATQSASGAPKAVRPPDADQIEPTVLFRSELTFKLQKISGIEASHATSI